MWEPVPAEWVPLAESAVLSCGCLGVVLSHDEVCVHFGIERSACQRHTPGNMARVDKKRLVMPTKPTSGG